MGSGPRAGIGELFLPELQKGSSIMPGKVNPVIPEVVLQVSAQVIGNDTAITVGGLQGQFELNVRIPLIARNLLSSLRLLSSTATVFAEKCVDGITVNKAGTDASAGATLAVATALNGAIGYDKATEIVKKATASGRPLREIALEEGVDAKLYDQTIDLRKIAAATAESETPQAQRMSTLANRPNTALLVIDVQNGVVEGGHGRDAVVANIATLVERARREGVPVVWVQHNSEQLTRGSEGWRIVAELVPAEGEPLIEKSYGDSFEDTDSRRSSPGWGWAGWSSWGRRPMNASARRSMAPSSGGTTRPSSATLTPPRTTARGVRHRPSR